MLVGNNKNLWRKFLEACARDPGLLQSEDPLDAYVEREVQAAAQATGCVARVYLSGLRLGAVSLILPQRRQC